MRAALGGLTTRGRCFVSAGLAALGVGVFLGQPEVFRVGLLLLALPLVSVTVTSRTRYRLACHRLLEPSRVPAGTSARVVLRLDNVSRLPTGLLLLEDQVPYVLGSRPKFVLDRVEPRGRREVAYQVRSDVRGRFALGPLTLRLADPFGLVELTRSFASRDVLVVTPQVQALPAVPLGGEWGGSGDSRARSLASAGEDDAAPREYRHGDDLRRVHWRSTARYGDLMVRREEQPWQSRATVLLDTRRRAHVGEGPGASLEWAVSAAASVAMHLARHGYEVRLVTDTGASVTSAGRGGDFGLGDFEGMLLEALAVVTPSREWDLAASTSALRHAGSEGLLVAVLGTLRSEQAETLARLRRGNVSAIALLLRTGSWQKRRTADGDGPASDPSALLLGQAGWRVLTPSAGDSLPDLWPRATRGAAAGREPSAPTAASPDRSADPLRASTAGGGAS